MIKPITFILTVTLLTACATKQYPQAPTLSSEEASTFDCKVINIEIAKAHSIQEQINQTGQFSGRTVLGFFGDFGIGNGMAKSDARQKVQNRLTQLESMKTFKCKVPQPSSTLEPLGGL